MRRILPTVLALGLAATMSVAAGSEDITYMLTDTAGDGNALNAQGLAEQEGTSTGDAQLASGDILGARIASVYEDVIGEDGLVDHVLTGLEFRTALAGEPSDLTPRMIHRFIGAAGGCTFWVQAETGTNATAAGGSASVRLFDTSCGLEDNGDPLGVDETVRGEWISYAWDADLGEMVVTLDLVTGDERFTSRIARGDYYILEELHNRASTGVVTAPVFDEMIGMGFTLLGGDIPADEEPAEEA